MTEEALPSAEDASAPAGAATPWYAPPYPMVALVALATTAAILVGNGDFAIACVPAVLWALWFLPLRASMVGLLAAAWIFDGPGSGFAVPLPWEMVGKLLWTKLSLVFPVPRLVFSGFDLIALLLFAAVVYRHTKRLRIDRAGWVSAPSPIGTAAWLSVLAMLWLCAFGLVQGGSLRFVLWQSTRWVYLPIIYALMRQGLRGPQDAVTVGSVVLGAGVFKAIEAIVVRLNFPSFPHATVHHDSVLFATCVAVLAAGVLEFPSRRSLRVFLFLSPVFLWAMVANNRRLVWSELALVALVFWLITPWGNLKLKLVRLAVFLMFPFLLYVAVGWNSDARVFRPIQTVRSLTGSQHNASTEWRDWENYNLIYMFHQSPFFGTGFGHPMKEQIKLPDVTAVYELEPYIPHNSVLGLWAFGGLVGFSLLWMVFPVGLFFTVRAYHWAATPLERMTALGAAASQVCYVVQGYGDLGFGTWGPLFTLAAGYALVGKICVLRGAWPGARPASWKFRKNAAAVSSRSGLLPSSPRLAPLTPPR